MKEFFDDTIKVDDDLEINIKEELLVDQSSFTASKGESVVRIEKVVVDCIAKPTLGDPSTFIKKLVNPEADDFIEEDKKQVKKENMTVDQEDVDVFETPTLQYLRMKKKFLQKYVNPESWGTRGSKQQVIAITALLNYFKETKELAQLYPEKTWLQTYIIVDNKNLVSDRILKIRRKLSEGISDEIVSKKCETSDQKLEVIEAYFTKMQAISLEEYETNTYSEVHNYDSYLGEFFDPDKHEDLDEDAEGRLEVEKVESSYDDKENFTRMLRWLRWKLYDKIKNETLLHSDLSKYEELVSKFVDKFKNSEELSEREASIWLGKVTKTKKDVTEYKKISKKKVACPIF